MKLAFSGEARYPDFQEAYDLYVGRSRKSECVDGPTYRRIVKEYCRSLAERLENYGMADLPANLGSIAAATITRRPQYRGKKFVGYGKMDWKTGQRDGSPTAFGVVFLPNRDSDANLRSCGFVANRRLYQRMKADYDDGTAKWIPLEFNDDMI